MSVLRVCAVAALASTALAQAPDPLEYFEKSVRPLLAANCQPCHNATVTSSGLDLSSAAGFARGGSGGPVVNHERPEASRLLQAIGYEESLKMPPTGKLKPEQIETLTRWIQRGAPWPGAAQAAAVVQTAPRKDFSEEQKAFWAFQPVRDPAPPKVKDARWVRTPIDRFILARLEEKGLKPAPPADKLTLLRRVTFDVTGLPPTEQEIREFAADASPQAYEKVVDRLLASPRYGERWGRHWLDVARYADSTGNDEDHRYPYAWRYRDYVIQAFNNDLPYDQFVREQVAGDLLPAPDGRFPTRGVVATGFLALGAKALAQVDKKKMLYDVWDEQVDVTSRAFLGLTMACARCHDHKFDPIRTKDYYSMVGMFASTRSFEQPHQGVASLLYRPLAPAAEYAAWKASQARIERQELEIDALREAELRPLAAQAAARVAAYMLAARAARTGGAGPDEAAAQQNLDAAVLRKWIAFLASAQDQPFLAEWNKAAPDAIEAAAHAYQQRYEKALADWNTTVDKAHAARRKKLSENEPAGDRLKLEGKDPFFMAAYAPTGPLGWTPEEGDKLLTAGVREQIAAYRALGEVLKKFAPPEPELADAVDEDTPAQQKVLLRGDYNNPGEDAPRAVPAILTRAAPAPEQFHGSGRLEVARWLTRPDNPMTARVMVNRLWLWHFGEGIVATPDNFGKMGGRPSHPELLDYLASRLVASGWSIKTMQRMLLLSNTYRMASDGDAKSVAADPENLLLTRFNRQRLDVEQIRDGMLAIDGTLDTTMGGTLQSGFGTDGENSAARLSLNPETVKRRTVYLPLRRSNLPTLLNLFDFGDATTVNGRRALTNVAPQALFMMNSGFVGERARNISQAVLAEPGISARQRVDELYLRVIARHAAPDERDAAFTYVDRYKQKFSVGDAAAWQSFCHILLTSNEFLYLD